MSTDELYGLLTKTYRNEINRASREAVLVNYYEGRDIINNSELLSGFAQMYSGMYKEKGMDQNLGVSELISYAKSGYLLISTAVFDGEIVVYHSYVFDKCNSRFLQSCSEFRAVDNARRNALEGQIKFHWNDLMYLKEKGITLYDWGGCSSLEKTSGIDKFKMGFGGTLTEYYNLTKAVSVKAKLKFILERLTIKS